MAAVRTASEKGGHVFAKVARSRAAAAGLLVLTVMAFQCLGVVGATVASASPTCSFSGGTLRLVDDGAGTDYIDVWQDTAGMVFMTVGPMIGVSLPGGICGSGIALPALHKVDIIGGTGLSYIAIWMSQSQPAEAPAISGGPGADWGLIDWSIELTHPAGVDPALPLTNGMAIINSSHDDPVFVTAGSAGVDLNNDGDLDITAVGVDTYLLATGDHMGSTMSAAGGGVTGDPVSGLTNILGGPGDDTIMAGGGSLPLGPFVVYGGINGGGGADTIVGSAHRDLLAGGAGDDTISGGESEDILVGEAGDDTISGGAGSDSLQAGPGDDVLTGGSGNDFLAGGRGDDQLNGGDGRDRCDGGGGDDSIHCEAGDDNARATSVARMLQWPAPWPVSTPREVIWKP